MKSHGPLRIEVFVEPMFQENGLVLWCDGQEVCWIVDPGFPPQPEQIVAAVKERQLTPQALVITHCHVDHIAGVAALRRAYPAVPIIAPRDEVHMLLDPEANMSLELGVPVIGAEPDRPIGAGETLALGPLTWRVLDVAGHSPGGLAYYCAEVGVVLVGDALFAGSIGRYDFPTSSRERLIANIRDHLLTLPDETVVYSGHGPATTIGRERRHNLVLRMELES